MIVTIFFTHQFSYQTQIPTGRRYEADARRQRPHPTPVRKVYRLHDHEQQRGHHVFEDHGRASHALHGPPVGACKLDLLAPRHRLGLS